MLALSMSYNIYFLVRLEDVGYFQLWKKIKKEKDVRNKSFFREKDLKNKSYLMYYLI